MHVVVVLFFEGRAFGQRRGMPLQNDHVVDRADQLKWKVTLAGLELCFLEASLAQRGLAVASTATHVNCHPSWMVGTHCMLASGGGSRNQPALVPTSDEPLAALVDPRADAPMSAHAVIKQPQPRLGLEVGNEPGVGSSGQVATPQFLERKHGSSVPVSLASDLADHDRQAFQQSLEVGAAVVQRESSRKLVQIDLDGREARVSSDATTVRINTVIESNQLAGV